MGCLFVGIFFSESFSISGICFLDKCRFDVFSIGYEFFPGEVVVKVFPPPQVKGRLERSINKQSLGVC